MCVMHTHTRAGAGVSLLQQRAAADQPGRDAGYDDVAYHAYGVPASAEECEALGRTCQHGSHVVLLNHGLLTHGPTIHGTLYPHVLPGARLRTGVDRPHAGAPPVQIDDHVVGKAAERMRKRRNTPEYGLAEWQGLVRTVDRKGADYRC